MATAVTIGTTGKGYVPEMNAQAKASLEKGRQERAAKVAQTGGVQATATANAVPSGNAAVKAADTGKSAVSSTVSISREGQARLAAEKGGLQATKGSSVAGGSSVLTYGSKATKFSTATPMPAQTTVTGSAGNNAASPSDKPQAVKFGSIDDAIAYGTRKANEQAAARNNKVLQA